MTISLAKDQLTKKLFCLGTALWTDIVDRPSPCARISATQGTRRRLTIRYVGRDVACPTMVKQSVCFAIQGAD